MRKIIILLLTFLSFATISYAIEGPDTNYIDFYQKEYNRAYKNYEKDPNSSNDFGKNVIPAMLDGGERMFTYRFDGYWKDVGTIESYWETSMDLLDPDNDTKIYDNEWKIFTDTESRSAQYIGQDATIENSIISEGCIINGTVINSSHSSGTYGRRPCDRCNRG